MFEWAAKRIVDLIPVMNDFTVLLVLFAFLLLTLRFVLKRHFGKEHAERIEEYYQVICAAAMISSAAYMLVLVMGANFEATRDCYANWQYRYMITSCVEKGMGFGCEGVPYTLLENNKTKENFSVPFPLNQVGVRKINQSKEN